MKQTDILALLPEDYPWKDRFRHFDQLDSTNVRLKALAREGAPHGTVLTADFQTAGRGRLGRSFLSPAQTGVYMSILLRPECGPEDLMHLTCAAAVAMCEAVEQAAGFRPGIKWTNDLVWGKRKLGGILTELGFDTRGALDYAIVGIGINCCQQETDFDPSIRAMAASLSMAAGRPVARESLTAAMMEALYRMDRCLLTEQHAILENYRKNCITLGKDISLVRGDEVRHAHALDVDSAGALIVQFPDGHREAVNSGEVSVRGMYGYL